MPTSFDGTKALLNDLKPFIPPLKPERLFICGKEYKLPTLNLLVHYEFSKFLFSIKIFTSLL